MGAASYLWFYSKCSAIAPIDGRIASSIVSNGQVIGELGERCGGVRVK
jgi:hypothetical protein